MEGVLRNLEDAPMPLHIPATAGRSLPRICAALAILVAGACTTAMNWRFSYQLGTTPWDSTILAVFSIALDVTKWLMLPFSALAWRAHKPRALAAISIWLIATVYSFTAAIGFAALNRDASAAERQQHVELRRTLEIMRQSPRWQASAACADATTKLSKDFCATYRATESKIIQGNVAEANPQTALISRLTGYSVEAVNLMLALFLAVACEVISAFGLFAILPPGQSNRSAPKTRTAWTPPKWTGSKPAETGTIATQRAEVGRGTRQPSKASRSAPWKNPR
jgi:hypothetical protein